jgi:hypothetical protein
VDHRVVGHYKIAPSNGDFIAKAQAFVGFRLSRFVSA